MKNHCADYEISNCSSAFRTTSRRRLPLLHHHGRATLPACRRARDRRFGEGIRRHIAVQAGGTHLGLDPICLHGLLACLYLGHERGADESAPVFTGMIARAVHGTQQFAMEGESDERLIGRTLIWHTLGIIHLNAPLSNDPPPPGPLHHAPCAVPVPAINTSRIRTHATPSLPFE